MYDFSLGLNNLWNDEKQSKIQEELVRQFCKLDRGISPEYFLKDRCFYVPNDEFMMYFWGEEIAAPEFGLYHNGKCIMYKRFVYPIYDFKDRVISFVGYTDEKDCVKYLYQNKSIFPKSKFILTRRWVYEMALKKGYMMVVDGVVDMYRLISLGHPASCQMGSTLTEEQKCYYYFIDKIIVPYDNDSAGQKLFELFRSSFPLKTVGLFQEFSKDIDSFVKYYEGYADQIANAVSAIYKYRIERPRKEALLAKRDFIKK